MFEMFTPQHRLAACDRRNFAKKI